MIGVISERSSTPNFLKNALIFSKRWDSLSTDAGLEEAAHFR